MTLNIFIINLNMNKLILALAFFINQVVSEGYYCPYTDLGATTENELLYDYYSGDSNQGYWTRLGETGWTSRTAYCADKGDLSKHTDAGEWKCNDSYGNCVWNASAGTCDVVQTREPDCRTLCEAVLNNQGPECLGNCPSGSQSNTLYDLCTVEPTSTSVVEETVVVEPTSTSVVEETVTMKPTSTSVVEETVTMESTSTSVVEETVIMEPTTDRIIRMNGKCYIKN